MPIGKFLSTVVNFFYEGERADAADGPGHGGPYAPPAGRVRRAPAPRRSYHSPNDEIAFQRRLIAQTQSGLPAQVSMIEVLGLESLQQAFGDKWDAVADHVALIARKVIADNLGDGESFVQSDALNFVILFATDNKKSAQRRAQQIARQFHAALRSVLPPDHPLSMKATLLDVVAETDETGAVVAKRRSAPTPVPDLSAEVEQQVEYVDDGKSSNTISILAPPEDWLEDESTWSWTAEAQSGDRRSVSLLSPDEPPAGEERVLRVGEDEQEKPAEIAPPLMAHGTARGDGNDAARREIVLAVRRKSKGLFADVYVRYQPIWDHRTKSVRAFRVVPCRQDRRSDVVLSGEALYSRDDTGVLTADLDEIVLFAAIDRLRALPAGRTVAPLIVPVHFGLLCQPEFRKRFAIIVRGLDPAFKPLLSFELVTLADSFTPIRIEEIEAYMRRFGQTWLVRVPADGERCKAFIGGPVGAIGTSLGRREPGTELPAKVARFPARAKPVGVRTYLFGAETVDLVRDAVGAGFDLVCGDGVMPPSDQPAPPFTHAVEGL